MSEFKCSYCDYTSYKKSHIVQHINKQNKCKDEKLYVIKIDIDIICEYCNKNFTTKPSMKRHLKTCKIKKDNLEEENRMLKEKLAIAEALAKKPTIQHNTQTNININLTPWNNPKIPDNIEEYYKTAVKKIFLAIPTLIKNLHFNKELPENHNICIRNARSDSIKIFNGFDWESMNIKQLLQEITSGYESALESYAGENYPKYFLEMEKIKKRIGEEKLYDDLYEEIKKIMHDKNYMIKIKN